MLRSIWDTMHLFRLTYPFNLLYSEKTARSGIYPILREKKDPVIKSFRVNDDRSSILFKSSRYLTIKDNA